MLDYNTLATEYAQHRQVHPFVLQGLLTTALITSASRVFEVGCGAGNYINKMARYLMLWGVKTFVA